MKHRMIIAALLLVLAGCSTMSYETKDGTKVTYTRLFTGADIKATVGTDTIDSRAPGIDPAALQAILGGLLKK